LTGLLGPDALFKIDPLALFATSLSERIVLPGVVLSALMILLTLVFGRFFCGWACPMGSMIDAAGAVRKKSARPGDAANRRIRLPKYILLGIIFLCAAAGTQAAWILDPLVIVSRFVSLNLIPAVTSVTDGFFIALIKATDFYAPLQDLYRNLKGSFLGVDPHYFSNSPAIFLFFASITAASLLLKRGWCRSICPLGALYACAARFSLFSRRVKKCADCGICGPGCRMGAIKDGLNYVKSECVLCMDCVYSCKRGDTAFGFTPLRKSIPGDRGNGLTRRSFLFLMTAAAPALVGFRRRRHAGPGSPVVIRPPAALKEEEFLDRCIRCGNCMKVCITNGLQPSFLESGLSGIWTPRLVPEIGYCEYHCTLCGETCPTGAIPRISLDQKKGARLGVARINRSICLPWASRIECSVCEEHCPIPAKAIKLTKVEINGKRLSRPAVDPSLCVGCGICQHKCPARPKRAIKVSPGRAYRA
jgi:MauM/NapG family ferredoxin protein